MLSSFKAEAKLRYPDRGSNTCCQGLVDSGFLNITFSPFAQDLIQSGIILFGAQSPPPITFPALAIPIFIFLLLLKKDL